MNETTHTTFPFGASGYTVEGTLEAIRALEDYIEEVRSEAWADGYAEDRERSYE